jgi:transporter family-2 protein
MHYALIMLAAGLGIPVLAALNAQLGVRIGSPAAAGMILFIVAFLTATVTALVTGGLKVLPLLPSQPTHLFLAGVLVGFYVLSITWIAPKFGIGNAVFFVLLGQLVAAGAIDHFGLFNARPSPMNLMRASGIAVMAFGVFLTQKA